MLDAIKVGIHACTSQVPNTLAENIFLFRGKLWGALAPNRVEGTGGILPLKIFEYTLKAGGKLECLGGGVGVFGGEAG